MSKYRWSKVDTAAIMFSSLSSEKWGRTFCYSAYFNSDIDPEKLTKACQDLMPYFPSIFAYLKKGFFWNYLEYSEKLPVICPQIDDEIARIEMRGDLRPDFRLTYNKNRVNIECSHSLGDGKGIMVFFRALLSRYCELLENGEDFEYKTQENPEENTVNAFNDYYQKDAEKAEQKNIKAFHFEEKFEENFLKLFFIEADVNKIKETAHSKKMTITEYLCAVLILGIIQSAPNPINDPVVIAVPVNLRRFFPTRSVRNFTIQTYVEFSPESRTDWTLQEILEATAGQLRKQLQHDELRKVINRFSALASNPVIKIVPNIIKTPVLRKMQKKSHAGVTTIFTNFGKCNFYGKLPEHIEKIEFINGDTSLYGLAVTCSCISYKDKLSLCFSHSNEDLSWSEKCAEIMKECGIDINVHQTGGKLHNASDENSEKMRKTLSVEKIKAIFNT